MNIVIKKLREGATRVTQTKDGIMSWPDKVKLDYLETTIVTSSQINGNIIVDDEELVVYVHPVSHPASIITQDPTHRFVSDSEKSTWNNKLDSFGYTPENIANKGQPN
jgi:hypothetical protein